VLPCPTASLSLTPLFQSGLVWSSNLLLAFASRVILGFRAPQDSRPYFSISWLWVMRLPPPPHFGQLVGQVNCCWASPAQSFFVPCLTWLPESWWPSLYWFDVEQSLCAYSLLWKHVSTSHCIAMDASATLLWLQDFYFFRCHVTIFNFHLQYAITVNIGSWYCGMHAESQNCEALRDSRC
jgi:hypothetical protein